MIFELIGVVVGGIAAAGLAMALVRLSGRRLPGWLIPLAAGSAMIGAAIALEYGWFARTSGALPEDVVVVDRVAETMAFRPWSIVVPMVTRFVALDEGNLRENGRQDGLYLADLYFFARWQPVRAVQMMVDCAAGRRADPAGGDGGAPVWRDVGPDDAILTRVCAAA